MSIEVPAISSPPVQERSRRTLERIVRAAFDLLEEEGPDGLTVQAVVDRAGSSVGSFYARFEGKDELIRYLGERAWSEAAERWGPELARVRASDATLDDVVGSAVGLLSDAVRSRAASLRALDRVRGAGEGAAFEAFRSRIAESLEELLLSRSGEITHPRPGVAVRLALAALGAVLSVPAPSTEPALTSGERRREAATLMLRYLRPPSHDLEAPPRGVEFFDVWG